MAKRASPTAVPDRDDVLQRLDAMCHRHGGLVRHSPALLLEQACRIADVLDVEVHAFVVRALRKPIIFNASAQAFKARLTDIVRLFEVEQETARRMLLSRLDLVIGRHGGLARTPSQVASALGVPLREVVQGFRRQLALLKVRPELVIGNVQRGCGYLRMTPLAYVQLAKRFPMLYYRMLPSRIDSFSARAAFLNLDAETFRRLAVISPVVMFMDLTLARRKIELLLELARLCGSKSDILHLARAAPLALSFSLERISRRVVLARGGSAKRSVSSWLAMPDSQALRLMQRLDAEQDTEKAA